MFIIFVMYNCYTALHGICGWSVCRWKLRVIGCCRCNIHGLGLRWIYRRLDYAPLSFATWCNTASHYDKNVWRIMCASVDELLWKCKSFVMLYRYRTCRSMFHACGAWRPVETMILPCHASTGPNKYDQSSKF